LTAVPEYPDPRIRDSEAETLMRAAVDLIAQGSWLEAAASLERAAQLHAEAGRDYDQARCLQLAATLRRSAGDLAAAGRLSARAASIDYGDSRLGVSIAAEQAESAFAAGEFESALSAWNLALDRAPGAQLAADALAALFLRRATTLLALDRVHEAFGDFDQAYRLLDESHTDQTASFVRTEEATLLLQAGYAKESEKIVEALEARLSAEDRTPHLAAEILILRARLARAAGHDESAAEFALRARDFALEAVAPLSYFSAAAELAGAFDFIGNRVAAYGALASAWVTLADLLGNEAARSWIEPCLLAYQLKWGAEDFAETKACYETERRADIIRA
jgi:tetratricopeptide (TPR) repeat protein